MTRSKRCGINGLLYANQLQPIILNTQGTGKDQKSVSDYLTELKVVDGHGQIVTYNCQTQTKGGISTSDILAAAKVHLGLFGITVEYTFKVVPMKYVLVDVITSKVADVYTDPANIQVCVISNFNCTHTWAGSRRRDNHPLPPKEIKLVVGGWVCVYMLKTHSCTWTQILENIHTMQF